MQFSDPLHEPSPHAAGQLPQSAGQDWQFSVPPHVPSPQPAGHFPQSAGQDWQLSPPPQAPSPQPGGHLPQSSGHERQSSPPPGWHRPFPQSAPASNARSSAPVRDERSESTHGPVSEPPPHCTMLPRPPQRTTIIQRREPEYMLPLRQPVAFLPSRTPVAYYVSSADMPCPPWRHTTWHRRLALRNQRYPPVRNTSSATHMRPPVIGAGPGPRSPGTIGRRALGMEPFEQTSPRHRRLALPDRGVAGRLCLAGGRSLRALAPES